MNDINKLINTIRSLSDTSTIKVNDRINIALNEHVVIETNVIGFIRDGIVIEADEKAIELLELNDITVAESKAHKIVATKLKAIEASKKRDADNAEKAKEKAKEKTKEIKESEDWDKIVQQKYADKINGEQKFNYDQWKNAKLKVKNDPVSKLVRLGEPMVADWYDEGGYDSVRTGIIDMANDNGIAWSTAIIDKVLDEWGVREGDEELEEAGAAYPPGDEDDMQFINDEIADLLRRKYNGKAWFNGGSYAYLIDIRKPKVIYASDDSPIQVKSWAHGLKDYAERWAWKDLVDSYPDYWTNFFRPAAKIRGQGDHEASVMRGDYGGDMDESFTTNETKIYIRSPAGEYSKIIANNKSFCIERVNPNKLTKYIIQHDCKNTKSTDIATWCCLVK